MIEENSGKFFRFKLDFDLGFGFAEAYDFTDIRSVDGSIVLIFNRIDKDIKKSYKLEEITSSGIAIGPIRLVSYPNSRGVGAWKFLFKHDKFILEEPNISKSAQDLAPWVYDWNTIKRWHKSNWNPNGLPQYVQYSELRSLETSIINTNSGVVKKVTMKKLIDEGKEVAKYYDLSELGIRNMLMPYLVFHFQHLTVRLPLLCVFTNNRSLAIAGKPPSFLYCSQWQASLNTIHNSLPRLYCSGNHF